MAYNKLRQHANVSMACHSSTVMQMNKHMGCHMLTDSVDLDSIKFLEKLELSATRSSGRTLMVCVLFVQPDTQKTLRASQSGQVSVTVPQPLLRSAFGDNWQQAGFKVQLSVFKDGARLAGRRSAAKQMPCSADQMA
jgi:hypothetical protein